MDNLITIDGPGGSGKGTVAKIIAEYFKISYLDTGLLYRALAFKTIKNYKTAFDKEVDSDREQLEQILLTNPDGNAVRSSSDLVQ